MKEKKKGLEGLLSAAEDIKLGTRPSAPRLAELESQHELIQLTQHATHESTTRIHFSL
jgi:hypothetical protein